LAALWHFKFTANNLQHQTLFMKRTVFLMKPRKNYTNEQKSQYQAFIIVLKLLKYNSVKIIKVANTLND